MAQGHFHKGWFPAFAIRYAQRRGTAFKNATKGRPRTSRGAATNISNSCWVMCAENRTRPQGCNGDTRAINKVSQPPAKYHASETWIPIPTRLLQNRLTPRQYSQAESTSGTITPGSHAQLSHNSDGESGFLP